MDDKARSRSALGGAEVLVALLVSIGFISILCVFFSPRWQTNDDVAMSMVAHGYGITASGSPYLIFSNLIWGYFVRLLPVVNGVLGYSVATLGVLSIIGMVKLFALRQLGFGWLLPIAILVLVLTGPVLFPQFTVNAGLLMVAAIVCWYLYEVDDNKWALLGGCALSYCSYLVRSHEFLLVLLIGLPLLPWRKVFTTRVAWISLLCLMLAIVGSATIDHRAYQSDEWHAFNALNPARAPITDFGAGAQLKKHPEILARYGYSTNDIDLLQNWFFVDPRIANPTALNAMLAEIGPLPARGDALSDGWVGVKTLAHPKLILGVSLAIFLMLMRPSWKLLTVWVLCIVGFFILGMSGRPGVLRVYIPVVVLLIVAPFLSQYRIHSKAGILRWRLIQAVACTVAVLSAAIVFSESRLARDESNIIRDKLQDFPNGPVVAWGSAFPFEAIYSVLKPSEPSMRFQLYSFGVFTLAPFSHEYSAKKAGENLLVRVFSQDGIDLITTDDQLNLFKNYLIEKRLCLESEIQIANHTNSLVKTIRCSP